MLATKSSRTGFINGSSLPVRMSTQVGRGVAVMDPSHSRTRASLEAIHLFKGICPLLPEAMVRSEMCFREKNGTMVPIALEDPNPSHSHPERFCPLTT